MVTLGAVNGYILLSIQNRHKSVLVGRGVEKMGKKDKKLCKLVIEDYIKDEFDKYKEIVKEAKYVCRKCGRVARKDKRLCKPEEM
ncbi:hypothetical protein [Serpentinicella alkaliphila]|uniref:Uncharacterized protein n=1 Tax=Serpentinicella alkaliphila TaxID=1734049 RepID=A0A4R2U325_9FIRM|nr:hypothetical protein [Serpentinicella alkaliphila]QUH24385.1 hypothetical protein HZR23_09570 [Serpentinicella alkaliphila]TCQ02063.1 hypothetical protein EDD79_101936 [Serpentinicella alkaliphila]